MTKLPYSSTYQEKRLDIQSLRGFAFLLVYFFHLYPRSFPSGFLGVDIFFVISGFVITLSISKSQYLNSYTHLKRFFLNRFKRLAPALSACVVFTLVLSVLLIPSSPLKDYIQIILTGVSSLFGLSNIFLSRQALDYFGDITHLNPFLQTWSLSIEFQFYIIFPFILFLWQRITTNPSLRLIPLYLVFVFSLSRYFILGFPAAYFDFLGRFWEILAGVFCAQLSLLSLKTHSTKHTSGLWLLVLLVLSSLGFLQPNNFSIPIAVLLTSLLCLFPSEERLPNCSFLQSIGNYSYSLYLLHWPIICFLGWTIRPTPIFLFLITSIILVFSVPPFFTLFESKQLNSIKPVHRLRRLLFPSSFFFSLLSLAFPFIPLHPYLGSQTDNDVDELAWTTPTFQHISSLSHSPNLILFGNSHARHLLPVLRRYASFTHFTLFYNESRTLTSQSELNFIAHLIDKLQVLTSNDIVVVSSAFFSENDNASLSSPDDYLKIIDSWRLLLNLYVDSPSDDLPTLLFFIKSPRFMDRMPYHLLCSKEFFRPFPPNCNLDKIDPNFEHSDVISILTYASQSNDKVKLLNLTEFFCDPNCSTYRSGRLLFRDSSHLTTAGSLELFDILSNTLSK